MKIEELIKALELNPKKEYILICDSKNVRYSDISKLINSKIKHNIKLAFMVEDINKIQLIEIDRFQRFIDDLKNKHEN